MEVLQLCSASMATGAGTAFKLSGWRMALGSLPVQVYTTLATSAPFVATIKLQGTIATYGEVVAGTNRWTDINGALWTADTIDALFAQPEYIRSYITAYTSGAISVRVGY